MVRIILEKLKIMPRLRRLLVIGRIPVVALLCLIACGCAAQRDNTAEEAAVIALLNAESRLAVVGEIDSLLALYVQDDKNARLSVTKSISAMITGWEKIRKHQVDLLQSDWMSWQEKQFSKDNVWVKVNGDNAWAVCDNVWQWQEGDQRKQFQNIQITICEKHQGRWLIAFQAFVRDPEHLEIVELSAGADLCTPAWYEFVEKKVAITDAHGHGPDLGSAEWRSAVEFKLGIRGNPEVPDLNSDEWCTFIDKIITER